MKYSTEKYINLSSLILFLFTILKSFRILDDKEDIQDNTKFVVKTNFS